MMERLLIKTKKSGAISDNYKLNSTFSFFSDDESGEKSVSVLLAGEESELTFIDFATADLSVSNTNFLILFKDKFPRTWTEFKTFGRVFPNDPLA